MVADCRLGIMDKRNRRFREVHEMESGAVSLVVSSLGALLGGSALIIYLVEFFRRPRLRITQGPYAQNWNIGNVGLRRFVNLEVRTTNRGTARRCVARAIIVEHPQNVAHIVDEYALHWADVPYSGRSTGSEPIDIGIAVQRLDVAFTLPNQTGQAWLAVPLALTAPNVATQFVLPEGEYVMRIEVSCENGRGDSKTIRLISPNNWLDLNAEDVSKPKPKDGQVVTLKALPWGMLFFSFWLTMAGIGNLSPIQQGIAWFILVLSAVLFGSIFIPPLHEVLAGKRMTGLFVPLVIFATFTAFALNLARSWPKLGGAFLPISVYGGVLWFLAVITVCVRLVAEQGKSGLVTSTLMSLAIIGIGVHSMLSNLIGGVVLVGLGIVSMLVAIKKPRLVAESPPI